MISSTPQAAGGSGLVGAAKKARPTTSETGTTDIPTLAKNGKVSMTIRKE